MTNDIQYSKKPLKNADKRLYRLISKILRKEWPDRKLSKINYSDFQKMINENGKNHVQLENIDADTSHMILLGIYSGARYSDAAALTRNDFSFTNNTININKSWQANEHNFKATKTKTSNRIIDLPLDFMKWALGKTYAFESITGLAPTLTC